MGRVIREYAPTITISVLRGAWMQSPYTSAQSAGEAVKELETLIRRHVVPHWDDFIDLDVDYGGKMVCEHCGEKWTENSHVYNGGCCRADEAENEALSNTNKGK